ncbi:serine/threonine-protein kinase BIK1-like [Impatiens glandulifera]|uniref:serine/threonine-protein kinase BIK1-like n=1 Tax=Impatiens glandulifera TaxID=253017 RepID=UPI001FB0E46E|nr:serine/threonine-protein kinase BIK1-like [Impatiens glandulifera]
MTNNFSKENLIGNFQFGNLYRGFLENQHFTIKIWDPPNLIFGHLQYHECRLMDELIMLRHQRIVNRCIASLYGYCCDKEHIAVVYNLKTMDSLHNLLLKEDFSWLQRIQAAFAFACLLKFFQARRGDLDPFLICNLSAEHVMLDEEYNPTLVDFSMITAMRTKKSDIFAFGVMLLSLITKRLTIRNVNRENGTCSDDPFLEDWAYEEYMGGKSFVHPSFQENRGFYVGDGCKLSKLALSCSSHSREDRPTIKKVVKSFLELQVFKKSRQLEDEPAMNEVVNSFFKLQVFKKSKQLLSVDPSVSLDTRERKKALHDTESDSFSWKVFKDNHKCTIEDLKDYTNNFSQDNYIGRFQFGKLFRGVKRYSIRDTRDTVYMIVKIWDVDQDNLLRLGDEMLLLNHEKYVCHPAMLRMFGYCIEDEHVAIVLQCKSLSMDSISNLLPRDDFTWLDRIKAARGVASLLNFLHDASYHMDPFIIRNLNTAHIMLDKKYNPMLVDFGLITGGIFPNRQIDMVRACLGCQDEVKLAIDKSGSWTTKSDVYSFGVFLLRLISECNIKDPNRLSLVFNDRWWCIWKGTENVLIHESLQKDPTYDDNDGQEIKRLVIWCVQTNPTYRPSMPEVLDVFQKLKVEQSLRLYKGRKDVLG